MDEPPLHGLSHLDQALHADIEQSNGQACSEQVRTSWVISQAAPPLAGKVTIDLVLEVVPPPHVLSHEDQDPQDPITQSTAHGLVLHVEVSVKPGHERPPDDAGVTTVLDRVVDPPPQLTVHWLHTPQSDTTQSTAHGWTLQVVVSTVASHALPPLAGALMTDLVLDDTPPLHDLLHADHDPQALSLQSTGHARTLQACLSNVTSHGSPPLRAGL